MVLLLVSVCVYVCMCVIYIVGHPHGTKFWTNTLGKGMNLFISPGMG